MAYETEPSYKWQQILNEPDEEKQGKLATEYVTQLETEIGHLKKEINRAVENEREHLIRKVMNIPEFKSYLYECNNRAVASVMSDWSGTQGGA